MLESIIGPLIVHIGKSAIDRWWSGRGENTNTVVGKADRVRTAYLQDNPLYWENDYQAITGNVLLPESLYNADPDILLSVLFVVEEETDDAFLLPVDFGSFEIELLPGAYSFYLIFLDQREDDWLSAPIYGIGLPSDYDLSEVDEITGVDDEFLAELVDDTPLYVGDDGPYQCDFVVIDHDMTDDIPRNLAEFLGGESLEESADFDLTGSWHMIEMYDFGTAESHLQLVQWEGKITGTVVISDEEDDGSDWVVHERIEGQVNDQLLHMVGVDVKIIKGPSDARYVLDSWSGWIQNNDYVEGESQDAEGTSGRFTMTRLS